MKKHIREALRELREFGVTVVSVTQNSHVKVRIRGARGREGTVVLSSTPSDRRAAGKVSADIRRAVARLVVS
jgi:hypothetical protein